MDWTRLDVGGRVTALRHGLAAGVTEGGSAFVAALRLPHPEPTTYDDLLVDSFGVLGVCPGDPTWLTGRGADGHLHLWGVDEDGVRVVPHSLDATEAMWAAPVVAGSEGRVLASRLVGGRWRLQALTHGTALGGGPTLGKDLVLGDSPDVALAFGPAKQAPMVVAGSIGDPPTVSAWALATVDTGPGREPAYEWRRVHLLPAPTSLCSVAVSAQGRHTWLAGHVEGRLTAYDVLPLPFRGLVRSATVELPPVSLIPGTGRPVVLVDDAPGDLPWFVVATARGLRLCWNDGTEWKAHPVPEGLLRGASYHEGAVHVWLGGDVWSIPDPS